MRVCAHVSVRVCAFVCVYAHSCVYECAHVCNIRNTGSFPPKCTYTHARNLLYTYEHVYIHTCTRTRIIQCVQAFACVCECLKMCAYVYSCVCVSECVCLRVCA